MSSTRTTLSTILKFQFVQSTFNVDVEPKIKSQRKYRPSIDKVVTETFMAMINSLFHTTNISLQNQAKKYKLMYKSMLLIFLLIIFAFIIVAIVFEENRNSEHTRYTEIRFSNDLYFLITYAVLAMCLLISLFLCITYNRLYCNLREQWRNECVRNLCESTAIWSMQFPIFRVEIKFPGFMYKSLLKRSIKRAMRAFKDTRKKEKKSKKKKNQLRSPRMGSPRGFGSFINSPAKYDQLPEVIVDEEHLNVCKMALCCCLIKDNWGFIRIFYKYDHQTNNDAVQYALNELQKANCLVDEEDTRKGNNVQIVQMVQPAQFQQMMPNPNCPEIESIDLEINSELNEGSEAQP
eukprot:583858_1